MGTHCVRTPRTFVSSLVTMGYATGQTQYGTFALTPEVENWGPPGGISLLYAALPWCPSPHTKILT